MAELIETATTEDGTHLWTQPYIFNRLFAKGQIQVVNSIEYETISCEKVGNGIHTILKPILNKTPIFRGEPSLGGSF